MAIREAIEGNRRSGDGGDCYTNGKLFSISVTRLLTDRPTTVKDYEYYLKDLPAKSTKVLEYHYETGTACKRLHIHGIIKYTGKEKPKGKKFYKKGWNVKIDPLYDLHGWQRYIRKDSSFSDIKHHEVQEELYSVAPYPHNITSSCPIR